MSQAQRRVHAMSDLTGVPADAHPRGVDHVARSRVPTLPLIKKDRHICGYPIPGLGSVHAVCQQFVVPCVRVAYVGSNSELDRLGLKVFGLGGTANPTRVLLTRVFGNRLLLCGGALGKQLSHAPRERLHVFGVQLLTAVSCPLPGQPTSLDVG